jgi:hypothetical protein
LLAAAVLAMPAIIYYVPLLLSFAQALLSNGTPMSVVDRDFANYWMGARLALAGEHPDLFIQESYFKHLQATFGPDTPWRNWGYAPHFLLMIVPLGWLGYQTAMMLFLASTLLLFLSAAIAFRREYAPQSDWRVLALATAGYALMMIDTTQNGFLFGAMLLFGLAWRHKRPLLAGFAFSLLTMKPQIGFLVPVLLVFERRWSTLAWAAVSTVMLVVVSALVFGLDSWKVYLTETLAYQRGVMSNFTGIFLAMMPTVFGSIRTLGYLPEVAFSAQWPITLAGLPIVVMLLHIERNPLRAAFVLACGTFVISPYAFNYDMGALTVVAAVLAGQHGLRWGATAAAGATAGLAGAVMPLGAAGFPISPLLLIAALALLPAARSGPISSAMCSSLRQTR